MKILQKNIYWIICTVILVVIALYKLPATKVSYPDFCITNQAGTEEISIYEAEDGNCYVFLPSYAQMRHVTIHISSDQEVSIGGVRLSNGMSCGEFALETPYPLEINNDRKTNLWFYQSANVATMYIDTATGSMEFIHKDKINEDIASITLYTADGQMDYHGERNTMKGRGNATWEFDKRPYALTLASAANLLEMGTAAKWVLLANATDETNLNNYLVYDLASGIDFSWSPECRYVDLYLNGEYSGLYLLAEKVEVGESRLNIDPSAGDFLCKFDLNQRWNTLRSPFLTNLGRTVEISYPDMSYQAGYANAISLVNQMENTILSGEDLRSAEILDLDSWVRRYLIDEISGNVDSDMASSYFYFSDGIFYAGPVWDYDMSFGNSSRNQQPVSFIAKNPWKSATLDSPYYGALYKNQSFYNRMVDIYRLEFLPLLQSLVTEKIYDLSSFIHSASASNSIRWRSMYDASKTPNAVQNTEDLIAYLEQRISFLNQAWLENTQYCTIQFELAPGETYWNVSVPKGSLLETSYVDLESTAWIDTSTQDIYDFQQPIASDMLLVLQSEYTPGVSDYEESRKLPATQDYITLASIGFLVLLLICFGCVDFYQRNTKRRKTR